LGPAADKIVVHGNLLGILALRAVTSSTSELRLGSCGKRCLIAGSKRQDDGNSTRGLTQGPFSFLPTPRCRSADLGRSTEIHTCDRGAAGQRRLVQSSRLDQSGLRVLATTETWASPSHDHASRGSPRPRDTDCCTHRHSRCRALHEDVPDDRRTSACSEHGALASTWRMQQNPLVTTA
jgi:hypothetical protein